MLDKQWGFLLWLEEKPNVPEGSVHAKNQRKCCVCGTILACCRTRSPVVVPSAKPAFIVI